MRKTNKVPKVVRHYFSSKRRFLPMFQPAYAEVIAVDKDGCYHKLQMDKEIKYDNATIRIYVRLP